MYIMYNAYDSCTSMNMEYQLTLIISYQIFCVREKGISSYKKNIYVGH